MAFIKNFGLIGVGSDVQFGKNGGRVVSEEGLFKLISAQNELMRLQVADGVGANDVATFGQLDALDTRLSGLIDNINTAVGLSENGEFIPFSETNYLDDATSVASALALIDAALKTEFGKAILHDGSVAFTGDQSMGGYRLTNLGAPVDDTDAATKLYVDTAIQNLGNAFAYVGTVAGGESEEEAFDLSTLATTNSGAYYKVATGGYFKVGEEGTPFYANSNDGLVFNTSGGVDIIDNTNSVVSGTEGFITVSGSSDTGFVVDLDEAFKERVTDLETTVAAALTGAGLEEDGSFAAFEGSNYVDSATSLKSAIGLLDEALKEVADDLAGLTQDEIVSLDGLTSVRADNTGVQFKVNVDGIRTQVGSIVGGEATDSAFEIDLSTAGEVRFEAISETATDVDIRLVPQGNGQVIVGETGSNGVIQADDGYALVLAGGDNAAGVAGDLILKAGVGQTYGAIYIGGDAEEAVTVKVTKEEGAVVFAGEGTEEDVTLKLAPKGEGTVDVSSARITNVAEGVEPTDAVNKSQLDAVAASVGASQVGAVRTVVATVEAGKTTNVGEEIKGTILRTKVVITTAFDGQLVVGDAVVSDAVVAAADIDETATGMYVVEGVVNYANATQIIATATGTVGLATVMIEYIAA